MQIVFTIGCGQVTPTGGRLTAVFIVKMPKNCCVVSCTNWLGKKKGLKFFRFPLSDEECCKKWTAAARREQWQLRKSNEVQ